MFPILPQFSLLDVPSPSLQGERDGRGGQKRSEIFVDIKEKLVVTINSGGYVLTSEIDGAIVCKSFLDGKPQIKLALNEDLAVGRSEALALAGEYEGGRGVPPHPSAGETTESRTGM